MLQTETQVPIASSHVASYNKTSFFVNPEMKVLSVKISRRPTSFVVTRSSMGVEGCQAHLITLMMNHFPVNVCFAVIARCYGHKEAYNKAQLKIMDDVYTNTSFMGNTLRLAGCALSDFQQRISFFFTFEREGLDSVNIYLTAKCDEADDIITGAKQSVKPKHAQRVMIGMLRDMVI